jgi:hypothetical protein
MASQYYEQMLPLQLLCLLLSLRRRAESYPLNCEQVSPTLPGPLVSSLHAYKQADGVKVNGCCHGQKAICVQNHVACLLRHVAAAGSGAR